MNPSIIIQNDQGFIFKWIFHGWKKNSDLVFRLLENAFCETPFSLVHDHYSPSHVEQSPYKFSATKFVPHEKHTLGGKETLLG